MATIYKGLTLDKFQEDAIAAMENNESVVVSAPTGSGKTLTADYIIDKYLKQKKRIVYTAPIKALSNQKYKDFSLEYGASNIGLMTGDIVINPTAQILIMTTEIYRNMVMTGDESVKDIAYVVFDEVHYINDIDRGTVWEESIIYSPDSVRFLCLSATIPNAEEFAAWISAIKHHKVKTVKSDTRAVPLTHMFYDFELGITDLNKLNKHLKAVKDMPSYDNVFKKRGRGRNGRNQRLTQPQPDHIDLIKRLGPDKVPCLFFSFSRRDCQEKARQLAKTNIFKAVPEIIKICQEHIKNWPTEVKKLPTTALLRVSLAKGIGFHHAGLLPMLKELVEELFSKGLIKVLYTTETFAVGINMPAKTVCFNALRKYDGRSFRGLNTKEYFQIAGRAGRRGIDKEGLVVSMVYRQTFRYKELKLLTDKDILPTQSQFKLSVNTTLNLIDKHSKEEIEHILRLSFYSYQKFGDKYADVETRRILYRYNRIRKKLERAGFLDPKNHTLTEKGKFSTKIFVDEIILGEIFASEIYKKFNDCQTLLLIAALCYEPRERTKFKKVFPNSDYRKLKALIAEDPITAKEPKFENLKDVTAMTVPIIEGGDFFTILNNTNLLEGDLIRFYGQILDRINQLRKASFEHTLTNKMDCVEGILKRALEGIYLV